jgi:hypothetical protein
MRAAGALPIMTVVDPMAMTSGGPEHTAMSPSRTAGMKPIFTVGQPGPVTGPPMCGTSAVTMGHTCISPIRAAGGMTLFSFLFNHDAPFEPTQEEETPVQ